MAEIVPASEYEAGLEETVTDSYREFRDAEGVPVHTGFAIRDIRTVEVGPWDRTGQRGAFVNLFGMEGVDDLQIHEIEPGGETHTQQHLHEEIVYVANGSGVTSIGHDEETNHFEWETHAIFFIPPDTPYRHYNVGQEPVRLVSQTDLPELLTLLQEPSLVFDRNPEVATDLDSDFYDVGEASVVENDGSISWWANFIPNIRKFDKMETFAPLGTLKFARLMLNSCQQAHIGEIPAGMYKNAHRHGPGANITIISGEGYSLLWNRGDDRQVRLDWEPWSVFTPPAHWMHQHFNTSEEPAKTFAGHFPSIGTLGWSPRKQTNDIFNPHRPDNRIPYTEESPRIRELFEAELAAKGLTSKMPEECFTDPDYVFDT